MNQVIKTGGDPRTFPTYLSLREEISKLSHPARPDVDWVNIERLTLALFEQNGVELQSAAWFTLARAHNAGLPGLNEGLSVMEALIVRQWSVFWPQCDDARDDILNKTFRRLQSLYRSWVLIGTEDVTQLLESERLLLSLREALLRFGVKAFAQVNALLHQVKHTIARFENGSAPAVELLSTSAYGESEGNTARVYVVYPDAGDPRSISDEHPRASRLKPFISGACCTLVTVALLLGCSNWLQRQHHQQQAVRQALAEQQRRVKQAISLERLESWNQGMAQLEMMAEQLNALDKTKGKYLTVSELKTSIYSAMQAFNEQIPVEEQLRRYAQGSDNQSSEEAQIELLLNQLQFRYQLLKQEKNALPSPPGRKKQEPT